MPSTLATPSALQKEQIEALFSQVTYFLIKLSYYWVWLDQMKSIPSPMSPTCRGDWRTEFSYFHLGEVGFICLEIHHTQQAYLKVLHNQKMEQKCHLLSKDFFFLNKKEGKHIIHSLEISTKSTKKKKWSKELHPGQWDKGLKRKLTRDF